MGALPRSFVGLTSAGDGLIEEAKDLWRVVSSAAWTGQGSSNNLPGAGEILSALELQVASFGITRIGELTGLDTIGIPVFMACRPNSRSLSVSQGKSLDASAARLGAVMEALEQAFAERHEQLVVEKASISELRSRGLRCSFSNRSRYELGRIDPERTRCWLPGVSLRDGGLVYVPFELAGLDFRDDGGWDHRAFRMSTVGLAGGVSLAHAALHALLEVVENGATSTIDAFGLRSGLARPLSYAGGTHAGLDQAVRLITEAGLDCFFVEISHALSLPTIGAFLTSPSSTHDNLGLRSFAGFSCRISAEQAALDALLEAAQSRLTHIAGSRDDMMPEDYRRREFRMRQVAGRPAPLASLSAGCTASDAGAAEQLRHVLSAVLSGGVDDVILVPLGAVEPGLRIVRVLAPGLQAIGPGQVARIDGLALDALVNGTSRR